MVHKGRAKCKTLCLHTNRQSTKRSISKREGLARATYTCTYV